MTGLVRNHLGQTKLIVCFPTRARKEFGQNQKNEFLVEKQKNVTIEANTVPRSVFFYVASDKMEKEAFLIFCVK